METFEEIGMGELNDFLLSGVLAIGGPRDRPILHCSEFVVCALSTNIDGQIDFLEPPHAT